MKWPSLEDVTRELELLNANVEDECDVRLQVYDDGLWVVRYGDASYDLDHHGFWGASSIPGVVDGEVVDFDAKETAKDLIEQCQEHCAELESFRTSS